MQIIKNIKWSIILDVIFGSLIVVGVISVFGFLFIMGYKRGFSAAEGEYQKLITEFTKDKVSSIIPITPQPQSSVFPVMQKSPATKISWGGPELWVAVNKARVNSGVNPLRQGDELCTIASIRLNEILEVGKLDGHEGFSNLSTRRPDLKWIFEKYNISEFLVAGASTPAEAVDLWFNTLGHKKLITGGEYVWGCIYAQNGFAVAIAAYQ